METKTIKKTITKAVFYFVLFGFWFLVLPHAGAQQVHHSRVSASEQPIRSQYTTLVVTYLSDSSESIVDTLPAVIPDNKADEEVQSLDTATIEPLIVSDEPGVWEDADTTSTVVPEEKPLPVVEQNPLPEPTVTPAPLPVAPVQSLPVASAHSILSQTHHGPIYTIVRVPDHSVSDTLPWPITILSNPTADNIIIQFSSSSKGYSYIITSVSGKVEPVSGNIQGLVWRFTIPQEGYYSITFTDNATGKEYRFLVEKRYYVEAEGNKSDRNLSTPGNN